jgi:fructoselysine-6-P-deglycase FrlB-like protein
LLKGDKSLSLKPKFEYILSFIAALLACGGSKALIYISAEVLAIKGSLALLVSISFASFNAKVAIVLRSERLVVTLGLLYKN